MMTYFACTSKFYTLYVCVSLLFLCLEFDFSKMLKNEEVLVELFSEAMQAYGRTDMDCIKFVDFTGCHTVIDLGGTSKLYSILQYIY